MLELWNGDVHRTCCGVSRRSFLQVGALGLGGLTLPALLKLKAQAADLRLEDAARDKSVVFLFLTGGTSQIESFDPKMDAPSEYRSVSGETKTSLPGVTFGGTLPRLARLADRLAVVRSFSHAVADHTKAVHEVIRGGNPTRAGMGSVVSRLRGANHPRTGVPTQVYVAADEIDRQFNKERLRLREGAGAALLGAAHAPFEPGGDGPANQNLRLRVPAARTGDRRALRHALDRLRTDADASGLMESLDHYERQAFNLLLGSAWDAFDLSQEDSRVVERYDTSRWTTGLSKFQTSSLGEQLLLARRLCEAGSTFVTVHNGGWDMHGGPRQYDMPRGMEALGRPLDHALSAFLEDIEQRGLSDRILLVVTSEFGRTPKLKPDGGRDHWPQLGPLAFAGGGLRMGQVIGQSTSKAEEPSARPVSIENLFATVLHFLFDVSKLRLMTNLPRELATSIESAEPIHELF